MVLQSQDKFDEIAVLNPSTGETNFVSKSKHPELASQTASGWYSIVDNVMCCLYRREGKLFLGVGKRTFELLDDVSSRLIRGQGSSNFQLISNGALLFSFEYNPPKLDIPLENDPTPFVEEEDFDFLLFVNNILKDKARRERIYNQAV
jgi:hypothetical protein